MLSQILLKVDNRLYLESRVQRGVRIKSELQVILVFTAVVINNFHKKLRKFESCITRNGIP